MLLESICTINHFDPLDFNVDAQFLEHIKAVNDVTEGCIATIHQIQPCWCQLRLIEKQEKLG